MKLHTALELAKIKNISLKIDLEMCREKISKLEATLEEKSGEIVNAQEDRRQLVQRLDREIEAVEKLRKEMAR